MSLVLNGNGTIQNLVAGGLPDGSVTADDIAAAAITMAKLSTSGTLPALDGSALTSISAVDSAGSNANGSYIKFKGGALICWASNGSMGACNQGPTATGIYHSATWTWTYPLAFSGTPTVTAVPGGGHWNHLSARVSPETSSASINTWDRTSTSYDQGCYAIAIGNWS